MPRSQKNTTNLIDQAKQAIAWVKQLDINELTSWNNILKNAPFLLYLFVLGILYIGNTHEMENTVRDIDHLKKHLKEVRWEYMSAKSDLMYKCKQSEIKNAVAGIGLQELVAPPNKIVVKKNEY